MLTGMWSRIKKAVSASQAQGWFEQLISGMQMRGYKIPDSPQGYLKAYTEEMWTASCIDFRTLNLSAVPWKLFTVSDDGEKEEVPTHKILDILKDVNPLSMQGSDLIYFTEQDVNIYGGAFWLLDPLNRMTGGEPKEIFRLDPRYVQMLPSRKEGEWIEGYKYTDPLTGRSDTFSIEYVVRFMRPNPDKPFEPLSPIKAIRKKVEMSLAQDLYNIAFLKQGRPDIILKTDQELTPDQAKQQADIFLEQYSTTVEESRGVAVMGHGVEPKLISHTPKDADYVKGSDITMHRICGRFRVDPTLLGSQSLKGRAEVAKISFWHETGIPELLWFAEILNHQFVPKFSGVDKMVLLPDFSNVVALQRDELLKIETLIRGTGGVAILTPDEARQRIQLEAKGGEADKLQVPANIIPMEDAADEEATGTE